MDTYLYQNPQQKQRSFVCCHLTQRTAALSSNFQFVFSSGSPWTPRPTNDAFERGVADMLVQVQKRLFFLVESQQQ